MKPIGRQLRMRRSCPFFLKRPSRLISGYHSSLTKVSTKYFQIINRKVDVSALHLRRNPCFTAIATTAARTCRASPPAPRPYNPPHVVRFAALLLSQFSSFGSQGFNFSVTERRSFSSESGVSLAGAHSSGTLTTGGTWSIYRIFLKNLSKLPRCCGDVNWVHEIRLRGGSFWCNLTPCRQGNINGTLIEDRE